MLNRIALFTFSVGLGAVALLRWKVPAIDTALKPLSVPVPLLSSFNLPLGTILPAFAFAIASRIIKLHNVVSDVFGIRRRFDVERILLPLAVGTGVKLSNTQIKELYRKRHDLMGNAFYYYASSTPEKAKIDSHYITLALDQWCWYWILVEANVVALITASIFYWSDKPKWAAALLALVVVVLALLLYMKERCASYALVEIGEILKLKGAVQRIKDNFGEI